MPKKIRTLGPPCSTRLQADDDRYLRERAKKAGLPPAFFLRLWAEKAIGLEKRKTGAA